jgi:hypothetical protein
LSVDEPPTLNVVARRVVKLVGFFKFPKTELVRVLFLICAPTRRTLRCDKRLGKIVIRGKSGGERFRSRRFLLLKVSTFRRTNLRFSSALDRIFSRLLGAVASVKRAASGDDPNASSAKRLGAQDRMIPIMPKRAQFDNSDRAKKQDF